MKILFFLTLSLLLTLSLPAQSGDDIIHAVGNKQEPKPSTIGGEMTLGKIEEDWFLTVRPLLHIDLGKIGFGLQVPLRFRVIDEDPQNKDDYSSVLREEDWDEVSDYFRMLRFFRYGHKGDTLHGVIGDLYGATIGHGTIVNRYRNNLEIDHYRTGLTFDINTPYGGIETLFGDITDRSMYGIRGHLRPWSLIDPESLLNKFAVGMTMMTDPSAPYKMKNTDGGPYEDISEQIAVDDEGNLKVFNRKAATMTGLDFEFQLLNTSLLDLTPYIDINHFRGAGTGTHYGTLGTFHFPSVELQARFEYRNFDGNYIPAYFDSYYEIQKFAYPHEIESDRFGATAGTEITTIPKRMIMSTLGEQRLQGWYGDLNFNFSGLLTVGGSYDDYEGPFNSNIRLFVDLPAFDIFQLKCYYLKRNFEGTDNALTFDEKSLFLLEGKYPLTTYLSLLARYWRVWELNEDDAIYEPVDDWSVGLAFEINI